MGASADIDALVSELNLYKGKCEVCMKELDVTQKACQEMVLKVANVNNAIDEVRADERQKFSNSMKIHFAELETATRNLAEEMGKTSVLSNQLAEIRLENESLNLEIEILSSEKAEQYGVISDMVIRLMDDQIIASNNNKLSQENDSLTQQVQGLSAEITRLQDIVQSSCIEALRATQIREQANMRSEDHFIAMINLDKALSNTSTYSRFLEEQLFEARRAGVTGSKPWSVQQVSTVPICSAVCCFSLRFAILSSFSQ